MAMGKYDGLMKYLGKEDSFSPEQIKNGMESQQQMDSMSDLSTVTQEDLANVDKLISGNESAPSGAPSADQPKVDPDVLRELAGLDAEPPKLEELQSRLHVTSYENLAEDMTAFSDTPDENASDTTEEGAPEGLSVLEPQFAPKTSAEEEIPLPPMLEDDGLAPAMPPDAVPSGTGNVGDLLSQLVPSEQPPAPLPEAPAEEEVRFEAPREEMAVPPDIPQTPPVFDSAPEPVAGPEIDLSGLMESPLQAAPEKPADMPVIPGPAEEFALPEFAPETAAAPGAVPEFELPADLGKMDEAPAAPPVLDKIPSFDEIPPEPESFREEIRPVKKTEEFQEFTDIRDRLTPEKGLRESPDILKPVRPAPAAFGVEIDDDKAVKIRNRINKIVNPMLRKKVRYAFLEGQLPDNAMQQLLPMILLGEEEDQIAELIDKFVPDSVIREKEAPPSEPAAKARRKVIHTEETRRIQDFQKNLQSITRYSFLLVFVVILLGFAFWRLIFIPVRASFHYNQGLSAIQMDDYKAGESRFETGKGISGPDTKWYNRFALAYEKKKEWQNARRKYQEALDYQPQDRETIYNFSGFYTRIFPPQYDSAIKLMDRLMQKEPSRFEYLDRTAQLYVDWGMNTVVTSPASEADRRDRLDQATGIYQRFLAKNPRHVGTYYKLLNIALLTPEPEKIDSFYDKIDELNKRAVNEPILTRLARFYVDGRRLDRAKKVLTKLIGSQPRGDEAYYEYARVLTINLDYLRAIEAVSNAIRLNDKNGRSFNLLGEIYYVNPNIPNNINLARENFERAIQLAPDYYKPRANLGHVFFYENLSFADSQNAYQKAFEHYKAAYLLVDKVKRDELLYYNLGWLYYYYQDYENALQLFQEIYIRDPANPVLSYVMGNVYYNLFAQSGGKKSRLLNIAKTMYDKAIEYYQSLARKVGYINPNLERHKEIYGQLARSYNNRGVINAVSANQAMRSDYEQKALLDFYNAKDSANKISMIYSHAEFNIKFILNKSVRRQQPSFDNELNKRTTLQKLLEEMRQKMVGVL